MDADAVPSLLSARMLNEFVYCPRLFYLEWVDDRWADNDDTEEGRFAHRVVDAAGGQMPPPELAELLREVRSLRIDDPELGLVAGIDRLEGRGGLTVPVDLKKGAPAHGPEPWPADLAQLQVQALLLRRAGYRVEHGVIYYAKTNQRLTCPMPPDLESTVADLVAQARATAESTLPPLPLVDSPKCPRCSLVGLCLPDETNALLARSSLPPRRIVPRDPDHRPVYVTEQGTRVGVNGGRLEIRQGRDVLESVRMIDVAQLCVYGHVQVSSEALAALWARGVPVLWFSFGGWLRGWAQGEPSRYVELRRRQVLVHGQGGHGLATAMIAGKIHNERTLLRRNARRDLSTIVDSLAGLEREARSTTSIPTLLGLEGTAARLYFGAFTDMVGPARYALASGFDVHGRARRPPPDPLNCLLSFVYALLLKDIVATCLGVGLDPFIGFLHRPRFGRPALALDLMEEFRPLIAESVVLSLLNNGEIDVHDFVRRGQGVMLTRDGRRRVIRAYERRLEATLTHPLFKYKISYRRVLDVQVRVLAAVVVGELPEYVPVMTR